MKWGKVFPLAIVVLCLLPYTALGQNNCDISCGAGQFGCEDCFGPPSESCPIMYYPYWPAHFYVGGSEFYYTCGIYADEQGEFQDKVCSITLPAYEPTYSIYLEAIRENVSCNNPEYTSYSYRWNFPLPQSCKLMGYTFYPFFGISVNYSYQFEQGRCTNTLTRNHIFYSTERCPRLSVPSYKQCDSRWKTDPYDDQISTIYTDGSCTGCICSSGCALTSAVMVLRYYGVTTGIDGFEVNPGNLNDWLNGQPDGYIGKGKINWEAITRYSGSKKVEFLREKTRDDAALNDDLCCKRRPVILKVYNKSTRNNHFVVPTGYKCSDIEKTWYINDPGYNSRTTLNDINYGNNYLGMRKTQSQ